MSITNKLEQGFDFNFQQVEDLVSKHSLRLFSDILKNTEETVYCLSLYYTGRSFSYLFPTYNTEQALLESSKKKSPTDPLNHQQRALRIRWSPCDFEYHADVESLGEEVEAILVRIEEFAASFFELDFDDGDELYDQFYTAIHSRVINALKHVCQQEFIQSRWMGDQMFLVNLLCGDQSNEDRIENAIYIGNPKWMLDKYQQEEAESYKLFMHAMENQVVIPKPDITIEELIPWVDQYQPKFKFNLDMLSVSPHFSLNYRGDDPIEFEACNNEFRVLDMLGDHPRHEALALYYQSKGLTGFKSGDCLFEFGRALATKLGQQFNQQFPEKAYSIALFGVDSLSITIFRQEGRLPNNVRTAKRLADQNEKFELLLLKSNANSEN